MSLRDWFAGMAMQGFCASFPNVAKNNLREYAEEMPITAYMVADAMLKARDL